MKKNNNNSQSPPHLVDYWLKGLLKEGVIEKKKIIPNLTNSTIKKQTNTNDMNNYNSDDE